MSSNPASTPLPARRDLPLPVPIRQPVHHLRESAPVNPLGRLASRTGPEERSASDLQLAELEVLAVDLQRERGLCLGERGVGDFSLYFIGVRQRSSCPSPSRSRFCHEYPVLFLAGV